MEPQNANLATNGLMVASIKDVLHDNWSNVSAVPGASFQPGAQIPPQACFSVPSIVVGDTGAPGRLTHKVHIAWLGGNGEIYAGNSADNGTTWTTAATGFTSTIPPAMCLWYGKLRLLWVAADHALNVASSLAAIGWGTVQKIPQTTSARPVIAPRARTACASRGPALAIARSISCVREARAGMGHSWWTQRVT